MIVKETRDLSLEITILNRRFTSHQNYGRACPFGRKLLVFIWNEHNNIKQQSSVYNGNFQTPFGMFSFSNEINNVNLWKFLETEGSIIFRVAEFSFYSNQPATMSCFSCFF